MAFIRSLIQLRDPATLRIINRKYFPTKDGVQISGKLIFPSKALETGKLL
jgi:hypothetical protein